MRQNRIFWLLALFCTSVMVWGQTTVLTDNGDGTWTLPSMLGYNVRMEVEYEDVTPADAIELTDNGDGTWTLPSMPAYNLVLLVEYGDEVYTEFDESTGTLTYYCDDKRSERTGVTELYDPVGNPDAVRFAGYNKKVTKVAIDPSMKNAQLTSMRSLFYGGFNNATFDIQSLSKMTSIVGLENLNTSNVTNMRDMFSMCESLQQLDLSSFDTKNVTNMNGMFSICSKLETVDVSSFDISKVTDMGALFMGCQSLTTICCPNDWSNTSAKTTNMFFNCKALVGGEGTTFDSNVIDATYARPDGGTASPGYFTEKPEYILGDANNSGEVEIGDITSVLTLMATPDATGYNNKAADANKSGNIEIGDITTILTIMAGGN